MDKTEAKINWLEERKKIVGGSEISTVLRYCVEENSLKRAMSTSYDIYSKEKDFTTPYELYHIKKNNLEKEFPHILSKFGHAMELYANEYLNNFDFIKSENQPQEIIKSDLHKLAGYTPDIFCEFTQDINFKGRNIKKNDKAVIEVKTINYFTAKKEKVETAGLPFQYILQNQYQTWIQSNIDSNYKWALQIYITPISDEYDNDFYKGQAVVYCNQIKNNQEAYKWLLNHYEIGIIVYPLYISLIPIFLDALNKWEIILNNNFEPDPNFIRDKQTVGKFLLDSIDEIKSHCKIKYGIDDGCVRLEDIKEYQNLYDEAKIYYQKCQELSNLNKEIEADKTKWKDFFLKSKILGVDDERFTLKVSKSGAGISVKCNFKTMEEIMGGKIATEKY